MALIVDQESNFKYFCKICKKGFGCGRALGGHMRAHGVGDESGGQIVEDDPASDWEDKLAGNVPPSNKRMYALRTNPNRLKNCRVCENCGKEFLSWKSFLEHGKCTSDDAESLISSPISGDEEGIPGRRDCAGWSKRKRSFRAKVENFNSSMICPSSEEEDLANCLMMLSNATVDPISAEPEESCASASKEEDHHRINPISFIAPISYRTVNHNSDNMNNKAKGVAKGVFECKACKKVFNSHQALGGHRASHKKVKGCFAAKLDPLDDSQENDNAITHEEFFPSTKLSNSTLQFNPGANYNPFASTSNRKLKVHECSICHRIFSSGQALGGHKRCHWITSNAPDTSTLAKIHQLQDHMEQINHHQMPKFDNSVPLDLKLDLNLPAPADLPVKPSRFEVSAEICLKSWIGAKEKDDNHYQNDNEKNNSDHTNNDNNNNNNNHENKNNNNKNSNCEMQIVVDDEADSKVKLAKLGELKDMNMSGGSSPWLQVGIGSATDVGTNP